MKAFSAGVKTIQVKLMYYQEDSVKIKVSDFAKRAAGRYTLLSSNFRNQI